MLNAACSVLILITAPEWEDRLAQAETSYDIAQVQNLVDDLREENDAGSTFARALLILAELYRIDFEAIDESNRAERRQLGDKIDVAADEALTVLESLPESSQQQRLLADLLGVKIRSKYTAKRFRKHMESAAARAIELDPQNATAYVSAAKPFLFADEDHRGDIERAIELLSTALEIDPTCEKAQLMLAHAEQRGETDGAIQRYEASLTANPNCRPARDALKRLRATDTGDTP